MEIVLLSSVVDKEDRRTVPVSVLDMIRTFRKPRYNGRIIRRHNVRDLQGSPRFIDEASAQFGFFPIDCSAVCSETGAKILYPPGRSAVGFPVKRIDRISFLTVSTVGQIRNTSASLSSPIV